jgi:hypothetical protein
LNALTGASETIALDAFESVAGDVQNWFPYWSATMQQACEAARNEKLPVQGASTVARVQATDDPLTTALARADRWRDEFATTFIATHEPFPLSRDSESVLENSAGRWSYFVSDKNIARLRLEFQSEVASPQQVRAVAVVGIVAAAIAAVWIASIPAIQVFLRQWSQIAGIVLGVVMWLWIWPSWLGVVIAAGFAAMLARQAWNERGNQTTNSTSMRTR